MKVVSLLCVLAFAMMLSSNAMARNQVGPDVCYETVDACFHEGDWWYSSTVGSGGGISTSLNCGLTDGCKTCGTTSLGKPVCVKVNFSAHCKCGTNQLQGAGPNVVSCWSEGQCEYRG